MVRIINTDRIGRIVTGGAATNNRGTLVVFADGSAERFPAAKLIHLDKLTAAIGADAAMTAFGVTL